jgi:sortase A
MQAIHLPTIRYPRLRTLNSLLLLAIIAVNGYIIGLPLAPKLPFSGAQPDAAKVAALNQAIASGTASKPADPAPTDNRLIIPAMGLDQPFFEGQHTTTLRKGLWLRPNGSTPDKGSNTVIVGHRFTYTNPRGTLYHLDAVHNGDAIGVFWQGQRYRYRVTSVRAVKATEVAVEAPSATPLLTIYTCTPLWLPKDRLVVVAEREEP